MYKTGHIYHGLLLLLFFFYSKRDASSPLVFFDLIRIYLQLIHVISSLWIYHRAMHFQRNHFSHVLLRCLILHFCYYYFFFFIVYFHFNSSSEICFVHMHKHIQSESTVCLHFIVLYLILIFYFLHFNLWNSRRKIYICFCIYRWFLLVSNAYTFVLWFREVKNSFDLYVMYAMHSKFFFISTAFLLYNVHCVWVLFLLL